MPNVLNKDRNKKARDDEGEAAQKALISAQQRERRYRLRQLAKDQLARGLPEGDLESGTEGAQADEEQFTSPEHQRVRSREELLAETRLRKVLLQEEKDWFGGLTRTPSAENQAQ